jgi:CheY-like chemotaxis protein
MPGGNEKKNSRIMVVEDELIVATNIENQLRKIGYEVIPVVDSGEEAYFGSS